MEKIGGRYQVEGFLGQGGTAEVYLARDEQTSRYVVVKRMKEAVAQVAELKKRFLMEARALMAVDHPAIVRILSIEEPPDAPPYLLLEALRGESLGDYLKKHEKLETDLLLRLVREIAHALESVHEAGVVHRDIKPDNLFLVGPVDDPDHVKVLDFGMARLADEEHDEDSMSILGTAQYMAPEQILAEPVDARTDVYGLGVVLFRLATGHLPFDAKDSGDLLRHQLFSPVPPPSWLVDDLMPGLEEIILRATRKSPENRYPSMRELGRALDALVGLVSMVNPEESSIFARDGVPATDDYEPVSDKGRQALRILAKEFGIYARANLRDTLAPEPAELNAG